MKESWASFLILVIFISSLFLLYESKNQEPVKRIKIYICKDTEARLFFMGQERDLKNIIFKLGIMDESCCSAKNLTVEEWDNIRNRLKHRNMAIF
tara:strand:- start:137 stop:421 length:285 start_codon:yes stop_codon:yes gene_type:complete